MLHTKIYPAYLPPYDGVDSLTRTELEVFKIIDLYDKEIADKLNISYHTVTSHTQNIRKKLGLANKREMVKIATKKGYIN